MGGGRNDAIGVDVDPEAQTSAIAARAKRVELQKLGQKAYGPRIDPP
jgi:hypothetical protein